MSDIIEMLETLGSNATLRHAGTAKLYAALGDFHATAEEQWALLRGDNGGIRTLLGAPTSLCCLLMAPEAHLQGEPASCRRVA